jgi:F-type H+-transporting ATPase subunit delta
LSLETIARRYATALADVVIERGETQAVQNELLEWGSMISSNALLREAFSNPTVPYEQKQNVLRELITRTRVLPTTARFLQLLLSNQRLSEIVEVNKRLALILDQRAGVVAAEVTTARPIPPASIQALEGKLANITGKSVRLTFATDQELIGGMIVRVGSTVYDGSVRNQLYQVERQLAGS